MKLVLLTSLFLTVAFGMEAKPEAKEQVDQKPKTVDATAGANVPQTKPPKKKSANCFAACIGCCTGSNGKKGAADLAIDVIDLAVGITDANEDKKYDPNEMKKTAGDAGHVARDLGEMADNFVTILHKDDEKPVGSEPPTSAAKKSNTSSKKKKSSANTNDAQVAKADAPDLAKPSDDVPTGAEPKSPKKRRVVKIDGEADVPTDAEKKPASTGTKKKRAPSSDSKADADVKTQSEVKK